MVLFGQVFVIRVLISFVWLSRQLESKRLSIKKLLRLFFGSKTEKAKAEKNSVPKDKDDSEGKQEEAPNATQIANDDTGMPVLSLLKENKALSEGLRRG